MGPMTALATFVNLLSIVLTVGAALIGASLVALAADWFIEQRPIRLFRRESIPTYYLQGHFSGKHALTH